MKRCRSVRIELLSRASGESLGPSLDVPVSAGPEELEKLVNQLKEDRVPYAFYNEERLIENSLEDYVTSTEEVVQLTFEPLAVFRVRRATRCGSTLPGHTDAVLHVKYSPDSKTLASAGGDGTVRFWDSLTGTPKKTLAGHTGHVLCVSWRSDGEEFASGDRKGTVRIWERSGRCKHSLSKHTKWITSLAWSSSHLLGSGSKDTTVKLWRNGLMVQSLSGHTDSVEALTFGGDLRLYSASRDRTVKVWQFDGKKTYSLEKTLTGHAHRVNALALSSSYVLRTGPFDPTSKTSSADDRYKAFVEKSGPERLASCSDDATIYFWPKKLRLTGHQQAVNAIEFSPDGRKLASASFDKKVKLWDGRNGNFLATLTGHVAPVYAIAWSPDSRMIVSCSKDSTLKVWHAADDVAPTEEKSKAKGTRKFAAALETLAGHQDEVFGVDWAPQGAHIASASKDRTLKIWHP